MTSEATKTREFTPITTQRDFDEAIKSRLARERERWEKETGTADLRAQLEAKDEEMADLKKSYYLEDARRALRAELAARGVEDEGRIERIERHVDLESIEATADGQPSREHILTQLDGVSRDLPELLRPRGAGSQGSKKPVLETEKPLTREEVERMGPDEINSRWDTVRKFLAGERD